MFLLAADHSCSDSRPLFRIYSRARVKKQIYSKLATHDAVSSGELTSDPPTWTVVINPASVDCVPFVLILSLSDFRFSGISTYACNATASQSQHTHQHLSRHSRPYYDITMRSFILMAVMALLAFVTAMPITPSAPHLSKRAEQLRLEGLREVRHSSICNDITD